MKVNGMNVDARAIGEGLYEIICDKGDEAIVAFGMIPKWIMDMFERQLREKVYRIAAGQIGCDADDPTLRQFVSKEKMEEICQPIIQEVISEIYRAASRKGMMRA